MYARGELISPQERSELTEGQLNDFNKANLLKKVSKQRKLARIK